MGAFVLRIVEITVAEGGESYSFELFVVRGRRLLFYRRNVDDRRSVFCDVNEEFVERVFKRVSIFGDYDDFFVDVFYFVAVSAFGGVYRRFFAVCVADCA